LDGGALAVGRELEGLELEGDRQDDDGLEASVIEVGLSLQEAQRPRRHL